MNRISLFLILVIFAQLVYGAMDDDKILYLAGKDKCTSGQWGEAIIEFDELIKDYPKSSFRDAALFWKGYCLEKSEMPEQAFTVYTILVEEYESSTWADDARLKKVALAGVLISQGKNKYKVFIEKMAESNSYQVRYQAGLMLAKMGDKQAIPILEEYVNDDQFGEIAFRYLRQLRVAEGAGSQMKAMLDREGFFPERGIEYGRKSFFKKKRNYQREQMVKKGVWTWMELVAFGLWQTIPEKEFNAFWELKTDQERDSWLAAYWKKNDPTPKTEKNENRIEFERRVKYARTNFSELYNPEEHGEMLRNYLRKALLLPDEEIEPWDARGELYMKFGEPGLRRVELLKRRRFENWIYSDRGVDFVVRVFRTNMYLDAIYPGELSNANYNLSKFYSGNVDGLLSRDPRNIRDGRRHFANDANSARFYSEYIENPKFFFNPEDERFFDLDKLVIAELPDQVKNIYIGYQFKPEVYSLDHYHGPFYGNLSSKYVIEQADGSIAAEGGRENFEVEVPGRYDYLQEVIQVALSAGQYVFTAKVTDHHSGLESEIKRVFTVESIGKAGQNEIKSEYTEAAVSEDSFFPGRDWEYKNKSFYTKKRTYQYYQMLKKGAWSQMELIAFGLWQVIPNKEFNEFWAKESHTDRVEWLNTFWNENDPTPGTVDNQFQKEFMHRIAFARKSFSELYNPEMHGQMQRLYKKKAIRLNGEKAAPWDARGELYLKCGAPAAREKDPSKHQRYEVWMYNEEMWNVYAGFKGPDYDKFLHRFSGQVPTLKMYLKVSIFKTNIYGSEISGHPVERRTYNYKVVKKSDDEPDHYLVESPIFWLKIK